MALFNSFLSTLGTGLKTITGGGDFLSEEERKKQEALNATIKNAIATTDKITSHIPGNRVAKAAAKSSADFLLRAGQQFNDKVFSPVMRTVSTAGLLTDKTHRFIKRVSTKKVFNLLILKQHMTVLLKYQQERH